MKTVLLVLVAAVLGLGLGFPVGLALRRTPEVSAEETEHREGSSSSPETTFAIGPSKPRETTKPAEPAPPPPPPPAPPSAPLPSIHVPVVTPEPVRCRALSPDFQPAHFAPTADGRFLLLADREHDKVVVWDWEADKEERRISVGSGPCFIHVRGKRAYVCNGNAATLSELDLGSFRVVNTIQIPAPKPCYMSATAERNAPIFITCGDGMSRKVVRLDPAKERAQVILQESFMNVFTVHSSGKFAVKQADNGLAWVLAMAPGGMPSNQVNFANQVTFLVPDRDGKWWLGANSVWDPTLKQQVATLEGQVLVEHPSEPAIFALTLHDRFGQVTTGNVAVYNTKNWTSRFTHPFALPTIKRSSSQARSYVQPVVLSGLDATTVIFMLESNLLALSIAPEAYSLGAATRLKRPIPRTIPAGPSWSFKLEVQDPKSPPVWKGLELPLGCDLDAQTGELTWAYPTKGEYDLSIKVLFSPEDSFLIEEHVTVENPK